MSTSPPAAGKAREAGLSSADGIAIDFVQDVEDPGGYATDVERVRRRANEILAS